MIVKKLWGQERWLYNDEYCVKVLELQPGFQCSLHYHPVKKETFVVVAGSVKLEVMPHYQTSPDYYDAVHTIYLRPMQHYTIDPGVPHRFSATNGRATIVEASTKHDDEDVVRLEDSKKIG